MCVHSICSERLKIMVFKKREDFHKKSKKPSEGYKAEKTFSKDSKRSQNPRKSFSRDTKEGVNPTQTIHKKRDNRFDRMPRELFIWGRRTVEAFLANLQQETRIDATQYVLHIIVDKAMKAPSQLKPLVESAEVLGIKIVPHTSAEETWPLVDSSESLNHQRICLKIPKYPTEDLSTAIKVIKNAHAEGTSGCLGVVLDQVQDPRNFGAIIRNAAFFGARFVVYGTDRQADISSLVLKSSAGGAFSVTLVPVVNINRALVAFKDAGAWIVGTALSDEAKPLASLAKDRAWITVFGNEGKGLRSEVMKNCDCIVKIPGGTGTVDSLNVSVACGVVLSALSN